MSKYNKSVILSLNKLYLNDEDNVINEINNRIQLINTVNNKYNSCNYIIKKNEINFKSLNNKTLLYGVPYSLKDNICTKDITTTGGSNSLKEFIPEYSATVYQLLNNAGGVLLSKDALDEFGLGSTGQFNLKGPVVNPIDNSLLTGGSSSGSVVNVYTDAVVFSIGSDTGDSIRRPASFMGVLGYKPSYGLISRYGVIPYAPSFDTLGIICKYVTDATIVAQEIFKYDTNDLTSQKINNIDYKKLCLLKNIQFVVFKNLLEYLDDRVRIKFIEFIDNLKKNGHKVSLIDYDLQSMQFLLLSYRLLTIYEAFSCHCNKPSFIFTSKLTSKCSDYYSYIYENRTSLFGFEVKRRMALWSFISSHEIFNHIYDQALRFRAKLIYDENNIFKQYACILMPCSESHAPKINDDNKMNNSFAYDDYLMSFNFTGAPSLSLPWTKINNYPVNLHISCKIFDDMQLLKIAYTLEDIIGAKNE